MFRIRPMLTAILAALALLVLAAPPAAAAQCPAYICYLDLVNGAAICAPNVYKNKSSGPIAPLDFDDLSASCPATPHAIAVRVDLPAGCTGLEVITEFGSDPKGHLVDIGDSATNDGFGGDAGSFPQGENAELHIVDDQLLVFNAATAPPVDTLARAHVQLNDGALKFVVADQFVSWSQPYTALATPSLKELFFLNANPANRTLYVAVNRVVAGTYRTGCGVRHVLMFTR